MDQAITVADQAHQNSGDSSRISPSSPVIAALPVAGEPEEVGLMRLQLHKAGIRTDGLDLADVQARFAAYRNEQERLAEDAEVRRTDQSQRALEAAEAESLRRRLNRRGIIVAETITIEQMTAQLAVLEADEKRLAKETRQRVLTERRAERAASLFEAAGCPKRHVVQLPELDGRNERWTKERDDLVEQIGYADGFLVALLGLRGNGKTEIGVSVIKHATDRLLTARYIKAWNLFNRFREAFTPVAKGKAGIHADAVVQEFVDIDVLVIDECHQRAGSDYEQNSLINLLDLRYDSMGCTILIGNQTRADFAAAVGDSLVSRIHQIGDVIDCDWPSYRKPTVPGQRSEAWKSKTKRPRVAGNFQ